ncbi:MAG: response regulator [Candidatus Buchananbacteria bacterium]
MPKSKKILVVDDEPALRQAMVDKFKTEGFEVVQAGDGQEGLKVALNERPDLILLDIVMPIEDGISMLKKLRTDDWGQTVPVIVLTNLSGSEKVASAMLSGAFDYLVKTDWKLEDLVKKVRAKLGQ